MDHYRVKALANEYDFAGQHHSQALKLSSGLVIIKRTWTIHLLP